MTRQVLIPQHLSGVLTTTQRPLEYCAVPYWISFIKNLTTDRWSSSCRVWVCFVTHKQVKKNFQKPNGEFYPVYTSVEISGKPPLYSSGKYLSTLPRSVWWFPPDDAVLARLTPELLGEGGMKGCWDGWMGLNKSGICFVYCPRLRSESKGSRLS